jgi:formimidoylglutamate deiminase
MSTTLSIPGFVNVHSHTFQRVLRGRAAGGDFWTWRDTMLAEAESQTRDGVHQLYAAAYSEMRAAGYTVVGEFHYLGFDEGLAAAEAAADAGIELVLLHAAYARGGLDRFHQASAGEYLREVESLQSEGIRTGVAPHSVRACPADWLREIGSYAASTQLPLHVHACEQPREIQECLAEHGLRPIELLAETGCLLAETTIVHATHADDRELDLLAEAGARVCLCPTTEADLGDGFAPVLRLLDRGIEICIGSDSNVRIDPLEELRGVDGIARRQALRRDLLSVSQLLAAGSNSGASALSIERWRDVDVDLSHRSLRGVAANDVPAALLYSCSADVFL